ncbi:hypothetical protein [Chitinophaga eiseniae]|uniref:CDP-Glycerol:Poly(Glycerophosphate) glycerophosphotransferase n=1 Tax=Chitinophaga eiseniae TaxID=634771 RepID=A0A847S9X7_9BACT|nr:hypothetical protein [Chitinophaga eiseniae]NLR78601.1 hypothetical protein [Chitinophaga eiseniae]
MSEFFDKYIEVKKRLAYTYKSYRLEKVLSVVIAKLVYKISPFNVKQLFKCCFARDFRLLAKAKSSILFTIEPFKRKDYYEIWNYVQQKFDNERIDSYDLKDTRVVFSFSIRNLLSSTIHILKRGKGLSLSDKLALIAEYCFIRNTIDMLEKQSLPAINKYVAFCGIHYLENLITQYFIKNQIPTYSLQHGVTYVFTKQIPFDAIAYENMTSDYHICWGQYTKDEMHRYGIPEHKLLIGGYPRFIAQKQLNNRQTYTGKVIVFLTRKAFEAANISLLNILKNLNTSYPDISFFIKLHPSLKNETYENIVKYGNGNKDRNHFEILPNHITVSELLESNSFDFAIAINTATYYESYIFQVPCLRFEDGSFDQSVGIADDLFTDLSTLTEHLNRLYESNSNEATFDKIDNRLAYAVGFNIDNYYQAIMDNKQPDMNNEQPDTSAVVA